MLKHHFRGCGCYKERQSRWVEPTILYLLMEKPRHGYELMSALPELGFISSPADPGAIYRTLRHLEEAGLVGSAWDTSSAGAAKRLYTITESGRVHLKLWTESLRQRWNSLDAFIKKLDQIMDNN
jgi:PadR family transcriptional regulator, regulatory protein PadR